MMAGRRPRDPAAPPPTGSARGTALRLLGRRDYTTAEISDRLIDRGFPVDEVEAAVERLTAERFLDDRRVALAHARTSSQIKGRGQVRVRRELEARGLPTALISEAVATLSPDDDRRAIDRFLARKNLPRPISFPARRRLYAQLLRRGFSSRLIAAALNFEPAGDE